MEKVVRLYQRGMDEEEFDELKGIINEKYDFEETEEYIVSDGEPSKLPASADENDPILVVSPLNGSMLEPMSHFGEKGVLDAFSSLDNNGNYVVPE